MLNKLAGKQTKLLFNIFLHKQTNEDNTITAELSFNAIRRYVN